ncbi:hypothetical protein GCM10009525_11440 [Streptosporangium amethystogenes subsp. fukuiense]
MPAGGFQAAEVFAFRGWAATGTGADVSAAMTRTHPVVMACLRDMGLSSTSAFRA